MDNKNIEQDILKILKGRECLGVEVSDKLNLPEDKIIKYLNQMVRDNKIKTGITEDAPYTKTYISK